MALITYTAFNNYFGVFECFSNNSNNSTVANVEKVRYNDRSIYEVQEFFMNVVKKRETATIAKRSIQYGHRKKKNNKMTKKHLIELLKKSKSPVFLIVEDKKIESSVINKSMIIRALDSHKRNTNEDIRSASRDLSTQELADLLNVSRPYAVKLIDSKKIPSYKVGSHRRVTKENAMSYLKKMKVKQEQGLDELANEAAKLGIAY